MNTIVEILGKQYDVKVGDVIAIDKLNKAENEKVEFDTVMSVKEGEDKIKFGNPYLKNAKVEATVVSQVKDDKVFAFKYKKRKNYKKLIGHRQRYTMVKIDNIEV